MSKVIKFDRLVVCEPVEIISPSPIDEVAISEELSSEDVVLETEEKVRQLLQKAEIRAKEIISQAQAEAEQLVEQANEQAALIEEEAYNLGYNNGQEAALQQIESKKEELLYEAKRQLAMAKQKKESYLKDAGDEIVMLAKSIAEKLLLQQLTLDDATIVKTANSIITAANPSHHSSIIIQISPEDEKYFTKAYQQNQLSWPQDSTKIEVVSSIAKGNCKIITSKGAYQLDIEDAMAKMTELLQGAEVYE